MSDTPFDTSKIIVANVFSAQAWDGGERHNHEFFLSSQKAVDDFKATLGPNNQHYYTFSSQKLVIAHSAAQIQEYKTGEMRRRALAKLTAEDKVILGIKD